MNFLFISTNCLSIVSCLIFTFFVRQYSCFCFALFRSPPGLASVPNLLCCSGLELPKYVFAPRASHLGQTRQLHNLGLCISTVEEFNWSLYFFDPIDSSVTLLGAHLPAASFMIIEMMYSLKELFQLKSNHKPVTVYCSGGTDHGPVFKDLSILQGKS